MALECREAGALNGPVVFKVAETNLVVAMQLSPKQLGEHLAAIIHAKRP